ncbi:MAG: calcium-binding protein [Nostoc sp.]|uniref:beta strand repeat-containing protein n=1 Tax=Nostoc sp. TaxID=1180 RepID=UPI002FFAD25F
MAIINGTNGNDTLNGTIDNDLINGLAGDDILNGNGGYDTLDGGTGDDTFYTGSDTYVLATGGGGKDKFVYEITNGLITITDFGGIGKGSNPSSAVIAEVDTLQFTGSEQLAARNLQLTQNGNNLEISFEGMDIPNVVLQNFALENLDNLAQVGNILFDGQTNITDSFDVFNANSTQNTIFNKNTVTFLNDLNNNVNGFDNSDDVINGQGGDDIIDGKSGNDILRGGAGDDILIGGAGNDTLESGTGNNTLNGGAGDDYLSADSINNYSYGDPTKNNLLSGGDGNDSLFAFNGLGNNTLNGGAGDDTFYTGGSYYVYTADILITGGGKDKLVYGDNVSSGIITITDFGGIGKGSNPSSSVIAELDTLQFTGYELFTARNLLLTQNGNDLEITFDRGYGSTVVLQNFTLENLDNLAQVGNILFYGQTNITDSFDVFDANSTQGTIFKKNTVTFLNDLNNNVNGFDKSDDVINGQGGDDIIDGLSGNDLLRGGAGNDTLIGGIGDDVLLDNSDSDLTGNNLLFGGDGNDSLSTSGSLVGYYVIGYKFSGYASGNNTLNGGVGNDTLSANFSTGNNLLNGDDGNDVLSASGYWDYDFLTVFYPPSGNNTLNGGAGNDSLDVDYSIGDNLLNGDDGNDYLSASGTQDESRFNIPSGNNTLNGGAGNDSLYIEYSAGNNLLFGGDDNDLLSAVGALGNNTLDGGNGNDILVGGSGNDTLYGGAGTDIFAFNSYNQGINTISDFNATNELIQVSASGFGGRLSTPSLQKSQFTIGASATTSAQRFIYDSTTGGLFFDRDGSAAGFTQVKFAQLSAGLSLTENNFVLVY